MFFSVGPKNHNFAVAEGALICSIYNQDSFQDWGKMEKKWLNSLMWNTFQNHGKKRVLSQQAFYMRRRRKANHVSGKWTFGMWFTWGSPKILSALQCASYKSWCLEATSICVSEYDSLVQRILHSKQKDPLCIKTDKRYFWRLWKEWWTHWWLEQSCSKHNSATIYTVPVWDVSRAMPNGWNFAFCGTLPVMIGNKISRFF